MHPAKTRLFLCGLLCLAGLFLALPVWLVNLELAWRVFRPEWILLERLLPAPVFAWCAGFAADLSSISTLVPVLLLGFPLLMSLRLLRPSVRADAAAIRLECDPYPPHFPFFLVMLGLSGTLYGLLIGLNISGVAGLGTSISSPEIIQQTLDQLMDGTATALLSSLFGLLGAFLAARPLTWLFRWAAGLRPAESRLRLVDTLREVMAELQGLGDAGRLAGERLANVAGEDLPGRLAAMQEELTALRASADGLRAGLDGMLDQQAAARELRVQAVALQRRTLEQQAAADQQAGAARECLVRGMARTEDFLQRLAEQAARTDQALAALAESQRELTASQVRACSEAAAQRERMVELLSAAQSARRADRQALSAALACMIHE